MTDKEFTRRLFLAATMGLLVGIMLDAAGVNFWAALFVMSLVFWAITLTGHGRKDS